MLYWPPPHSDVFRSVLVHPRLVPLFNTLLGQVKDGSVMIVVVVVVMVMMMMKKTIVMTISVAMVLLLLLLLLLMLLLLLLLIMLQGYRMDHQPIVIAQDKDRLANALRVTCDVLRLTCDM